MIDVGVWEKIKKLKDRFKGEDPSAIQQIDEWEKRLRQLAATRQFMESEAAQIVYKALKDRVKDNIKYRLKSGLSDAERRESEAKEAECRWMLNLFNPSYESEIESLESIIDSELEGG